eukprot:2559325-Prymnesium_polylepis.1
MRGIAEKSDDRADLPLACPQLKWPRFLPILVSCQGLLEQLEKKILLLLQLEREWHLERGALGRRDFVRP